MPSKTGLSEKKVKSIYITPGAPWEWSTSDIEPSKEAPGGVRREPNQNGHIESFHGKLRDELLNREIFGSLLEAKVLVESHRIEYNQNRPHSSLGYHTPDEAAQSWQSPLRPTALAPSASSSTININKEPLLQL